MNKTNFNKNELYDNTYGFIIAVIMMSITITLFLVSIYYMFKFIYNSYKKIMNLVNNSNELMEEMINYYKRENIKIEKIK